jgi:hypothetical protein
MSGILRTVESAVMAIKIRQKVVLSINGNRLSMFMGDDLNSRYLLRSSRWGQFHMVFRALMDWDALAMRCQCHNCRTGRRRHGNQCI